MQYSDQQKRSLQDLGRTEAGTDLLAVLESAKVYYSSINTIDKSRPAEVQIEGRDLFCKFIDELSAQIRKQPHRPKPVAPTSYE